MKDIYLKFQETLHCFVFFKKKQYKEIHTRYIVVIKLRSIQRFTLKTSREKTAYNKKESSVTSSGAAQMLRKQTELFQQTELVYS